MAIPINNVPRRVVYAASGTGPYNFTFEILAATDIAVYRDNTLLTLTTNYTVTINANGTGFVTLTATPTGATQIAIVGNRTIQRLTDFVTGGDFFANTLNDELDQQTIFNQQNAEGLNRALQAPISDPSSINMILPAAATGATKYLGFDASGNPAALAGTGTASVINLATDVTGVLPVANGGTGSSSLGTGVATALGQNVTGSGGIVLATSPALTTPTLGAASATSVALAAGAVGTPSLTATGDLNTGMWFPAADTIAFSEGGIEVVRISSAGNVGIGTTSPGSPLTVKTDTDFVVAIRTTTASTGARLVALNAAQDGYKDLVIDGSILYFSTSGSERMRVTAGGEVYIAGTTDQGAYNLQVNGTGVWGAGAYVNGSDERLKDNIQTLNDGLAIVSQLRPVTFQYKPEHTKDQSIQPGFIAQELQQAMTGKAYLGGVVQSGPEYLNVAYQNLIPILTKAIQEQQAVIESLAVRIAELEAKA